MASSFSPSDLRSRLAFATGPGPTTARPSTPASISTPAVGWRVDASHHVEGSDQAAEDTTGQDDEPSANEFRRDWLRLHAADLIDNLTVWSDDLIRRETNLHIRTAELEQQQRQFRLKLQSTTAQLRAWDDELRAQEAALAIRSEQLRATARQIAIAHWPG